MNEKINLLVTGGCGFIGSNFVNYIFTKNKYNIINIDAIYYCANENNVNKEIRNSKNYTLIKGNLCSEDLVTHVLEFIKLRKLFISHKVTFKTRFPMHYNIQKIIF